MGPPTNELARSAIATGDPRGGAATPTRRTATSCGRLSPWQTTNRFIQKSPGSRRRRLRRPRIRGKSGEFRRLLLHQQFRRDKTRLDQRCSLTEVDPVRDASPPFRRNQATRETAGRVAAWLGTRLRIFSGPGFEACGHKVTGSHPAEYRHDAACEVPFGYGCAAHNFIESEKLIFQIEFGACAVTCDSRADLSKYPGGGR
jgi:hypothetical protein